MRPRISLAAAMLLIPCAVRPLAVAQAAQPISIPSTLRVSSDFPGGSARVLSLDETNGVVRITPNGNPDRGWPCWWYLRLDGVNTNKAVVLEVVANEAIVRSDKPGETRRLPAAWSLPARAAYSTDGRNWKQTAPGERQNNRSVYRVPGASRALWLAWGPPFTSQDADQLLERATRLCPFAKRFELARTREGRAVPALRIAEPGAAGSERFGIWVLARQHAWECGSSWVACGLTEWLVSTNPSAKVLRQKADIVIVPIMDVDNVETGNGGKMQRPNDQNRDWSPSPYFPEVRAAMDHITSLSSTGRFDVFLDLHNPGASERGVHIYIPPKPLVDPVRLANQNAFTNLLRSQMTGPIPFTGKLGPWGKTYDPATDTTSDAWAAHAGGSHVVSLTIETAWNTPASTPSGYRQIGEQLGRCLERYLRTGPIRSGVAD